MNLMALIWGGKWTVVTEKGWKFLTCVCVCVCVCVCFQDRIYVAMAVLELALYTRMASNSQRSGFKGMYHYARLLYSF